MDGKNKEKKDREKRSTVIILTNFDNSNIYYKYKNKLIRKSAISKEKNDIPLRKLRGMSVTDWPPWTGNRISNILRRSRG